VHAEVQDLITTADSSIDPRFNRRSMREVVPIEQALTLRGIEVSRKLGEELGMSERAVQVDEEAGDRAGIERDSMAALERASQTKCAEIASSMTPQRITSGLAVEQVPIPLGDTRATMLAAQHERVPLHGALENA
jgi:hypothetical protein